MLAKAISGIPSGPDLDHLRDAVCSALEAAGHNTAAALLANGNWTQTGDAVQVQVRMKKTMLGLTMNAEAEKIVSRPRARQDICNRSRYIGYQWQLRKRRVWAPARRVVDSNPLLTTPAVKK